ncbi:unnamed protein product [Moneuplotes crassus]|uniref:Uncharacterized protein n=1 Tax=Euplotes crassus TaxID=5936 RepID=A0AAD2CXD0_EUPCR|nr:unnamed protein product [Moneuplotes crassus]
MLAIFIIAHFFPVSLLLLINRLYSIVEKPAVQETWRERTSLTILAVDFSNSRLEASPALFTKIEISLSATLAIRTPKSRCYSNKTTKVSAQELLCSHFEC